MVQIYSEGLPAELLPGSFDGIPFLLERSAVEGGRKDVKKEFPNTGRQLIEDLGPRLSVYNLDMIISAGAEGYIQRRNRLLNRLGAGGKAVLVLPIDGPIDNIVCRSFTLIEDFTRLGDGRISARFEIDNSTGVPTRAAVTTQDVASAADAVRAQVSAEFSTRYAAATTPTGYAAAVGKVRDIVAAFEENVTFLSVSANVIDEFSTELTGLSDDVLRVANRPQELADSVGRLFTSVSNLYSTPAGAFDVLKKFFSFGEDDVLSALNTATRIRREQNRAATNGLMQVQALSLAYSAASQIEFDTIAEVDEVIDALENEYRAVVDANSSDINSIFAESSGVSVEVINGLDELRAQTKVLFDEQKLSARRLTAVRTDTMPARVLAYQYYGDSTEGEAIAAINGELNVSFLKGQIEILTE